MNVPVVRTPVSLVDFTRAAMRNWGGALPSEKSLALLMGQYRVETGGMGENTWNWNVGNHKYSGSGDYMMLRGTCEAIPVSSVADLVARGAIKSPESSNCRGQVAPAGKVMVEWLPPHRTTWFQAFGSLDEGMRYHLDRLRKRFPRAWGALQEESTPEGFAQALKSQGYFTADAGAYARLLKTGYDAYLASGAYSEALRSLNVTPPTPSSTGPNFPWALAAATLLAGGTLFALTRKDARLPNFTRLRFA
jgi:hypothetical protein